MMERGLERSRATWTQMRASQPFSYQAQSYKHGIWSQQEMRVSLYAVGLLAGVFGALWALDASYDQPDGQQFKAVIETRRQQQQQMRAVEPAA
jgi:hypothetical protein